MPQSHMAGAENIHLFTYKIFNPLSLPPEHSKSVAPPKNKNENKKCLKVDILIAWSTACMGMVV